MSQTNQGTAQNRVTNLQASAHLMMLDAGLYCISHAPAPPMGTDKLGFPGIRITEAPNTIPGSVEIVTFTKDGWLGAEGSAALVRVFQGPTAVLVTIYKSPDEQHKVPNLQVTRLADVPMAQSGAIRHIPPAVVAVAPNMVAPGSVAPARPPEPVSKDVIAHIQQRGDVPAALGTWVGQPGSRNWIEGFGLSVSTPLGADGIEYQAVLGKNWLSPWAAAGEFCGSRGMGLPILGLRFRLRGDKAAQFRYRLTASFVDGTAIGPLDNPEVALEAGSLSPLEAFLLEIIPVEPKAEGAHDHEEHDEDDALLSRVGDELEQIEQSEKASAKPKARSARRSRR